MKLEEGIKQKGAPYFIPDVERSALPKFFKSLGFKKGVEIGVSWGQNIVDYCEAGLEIYGIDPWDPMTDEDHFKKIVSIDGKYGRNLEGVYQLAKERTEKYPNCHLVKATSIEALDMFPDRSLDFIYIDGNHSFGYVAMDLMKWCRKVKKGGVIAGHDYFSKTGNRGVRQVGAIVRAFADAYDFENWYVLGTKETYDEYLKRTGRDKNKDLPDTEDIYLSFMFFKHW